MSAAPPIMVRISALEMPPGVAVDRSELTATIERELAGLLAAHASLPAAGALTLEGGELSVGSPLDAQSAGRALAAHIHAGLLRHWGVA